MEQVHDSSEFDSPIALQVFGNNWNFLRAKYAQSASQELVDLLIQYNNQADAEAKSRWLPFVLDARNECIGLLKFSDGKSNQQKTYFHGIYSGLGMSSIRYLYSTNNVKWSRDIHTKALTLLYDFPKDMCPIDPLEVDTDVPQLVLDAIEPVSLNTVLEILSK